MTPDSEAAFPYRIQRIEQELALLQQLLEQHDRELAVQKEQISGAGGLVNSMNKLSGKVDSLNRALYAFAGSFIVAAVTIAVTVGGH